jgi:hypothetical protein
VSRESVCLGAVAAKRRGARFANRDTPASGHALGQRARTQRRAYRLCRHRRAAFVRRLNTTTRTPRCRAPPIACTSPRAKATIADQLLFKSGDHYRASLLQESARILRDTRYLRDAVIRPVAYHDGLVDVEVTTQDVWTLNPGFSFGRKGGKNTGGVEVEDLNFLGMGTQFGIGFTRGVDRDSKTIYYRDRNLGSSWWDLATRYSDNSDGRLAEFGLAHPFYALDTRWAAGVALSDNERVDSRYDLGDVIDEYQAHEKLASIYWGLVQGLVSGWSRRYSVGLSYDDVAFEDAPAAPAARLLPEDRHLVYPWFSVEWVQDEFVTGRNRDQIEKTEDYSLGWRARAQLGYASSAFGSDRDAYLWSAGVTKGLLLGERQSMFFDFDGAGRIEMASCAARSRGSARVIISASRRVACSSWSCRPSRATTSTPTSRSCSVATAACAAIHCVTRPATAAGCSPPSSASSPTGTRSRCSTSAPRCSMTWARPGAAIRSALPRRGLLRDFGFGLRLGNSRSALGNVLHIDVAFPLDGDSSINNMQFLIETRKSF